MRRAGTLNQCDSFHFQGSWKTNMLLLLMVYFEGANKNKPIIKFSNVERTLLLLKALQHTR